MHASTPHDAPDGAPGSTDGTAPAERARSGYRAGLDKDPAAVAAMFDDVAERYDLTNDVLSAGQTRRWRRAVAAAVDARPGLRVLDLAAGTGSSSAPFVTRGASVVACDFSLGMLAVGAERNPGPAYIAGDATRLPFADGAFDVVTISFGLRNVQGTATALAEMRRVTAPGGRLVVCEFSAPTVAPVRTAYMEYLMRALPAVAERVSSNPAAYVYLAESIRAWPDQVGLASIIAGAGWDLVQWQNLTGGIVAVHTAVNPGPDAPTATANH